MTWPYSSLFMIEGMVTLTRIETQSVHRWSDKLFCLFLFVVFVCVFKRSTFVDSAWSFGFFHPRYNGQWPPTWKDFLSQMLSITYIVLSYFLRKSQYFPFWIFSAQQGHYWDHFYNVFGMTRSLTGNWTRDLPHSKPTLYH